MIYDFCMQHRGRVVATKGRDQLIKPVAHSLIDVTWRGQTLKQGVQLWHINTDYFKSLLMSRLTWPVDQPGRFWVPQDVTDDYCLQLTAESRVAKASGQATWIKVRRENHWLDCEVINFAMAQSLGLDRRMRASKKDDKPAKAGPTEPSAPIPTMPTNVPMRPQAVQPRRNWTTNWR